MAGVLKDKEVSPKEAPHGRNGNSELPTVRIRLPGSHRLESEFATEVGQVLGSLGVAFRRDDRVVEIQEEEFSGELDRFKLARGGLRKRPFLKLIYVGPAASR